MIGAHMVHIILHFIKKSLSKKDDFQYYMKTLCTITMFTTYMGAYLMIQLQQEMDYSDDMLKCRDHSNIQSKIAI
jgi:hypothetical protein